MALLSLQSITIPILLIDKGSFYYTYAFTFNTSFITLMNDIPVLKGKANGQLEDTLFYSVKGYNYLHNDFQVQHKKPVFTV